MSSPLRFCEKISIKNFKSIRELALDCRRVNLFIGAPNTGKSNILEALGLFCAPYSTNQEKFLSEFVRYEVFTKLFYDKKERVEVEVRGKKMNYYELTMLHHSWADNSSLIISDYHIDRKLFENYRNTEDLYSTLERTSGKDQMLYYYTTGYSKHNKQEFKGFIP